MDGGGAWGVGYEEQPVVDDFAGGLVGIAGEVVGFAGAKEEFVAEEVTLRVEDGLAAEEAAGGGDGRMWRVDLRGDCRFARSGDGRHAVFATSGRFQMRRFILFIDQVEYCVSTLRRRESF